MFKKSGRHEIGVHSWIHEMNSTLPDSIERRLLMKAIAELKQMTGETPVGYRAPSWNFSPNTLSILRDLGFRYESSLMADDRAYELMQEGKAFSRQANGAPLVQHSVAYHMENADFVAAPDIVTASGDFKNGQPVMRLQSSTGGIAEIAGTNYDRDHADFILGHQCTDLC